VSDDERKRSKEAILARRAKFLAAAIGGAALTASCGGRVEGSNENGDTDWHQIFSPGDGDGDVCLSYGCLTMPCLAPPCEPQYGCDPYGAGGAEVCLSLVCLSGAGPCLDYPIGGYGGQSPQGTGGEATGGVDGSGGEPEICLTAPLE
jgi:hypothetical protein